MQPWAPTQLLLALSLAVAVGYLGSSSLPQRSLSAPSLAHGMELKWGPEVEYLCSYSLIDSGTELQEQEGSRSLRRATGRVLRHSPNTHYGFMKKNPPRMSGIFHNCQIQDNRCFREWYRLSTMAY